MHPAALRPSPDNLVPTSHEGADVQLHRSRRVGRIAITLAVFVPAAVVGAYLDWMLWADEGGILVTLAAIAILLVAGLLALVGLLAHRGVIRLTATLTLAVGLGLIAGQILGPSREPLIQQFDGTMTLHLTAPVDAVATGPANCANVASATEFSVTGDSNMRLETPDRPFVMVYANVGDRWQVRDDSPRKNGVRLDVDVTGQLVTADGKPSTTEMAATSTSTLEASFSNQGGSIRFAGLVPQGAAAPVAGAEPFAGTLEWTCGPVQ